MEVFCSCLWETTCFINDLPAIALQFLSRMYLRCRWNCNSYDWFSHVTSWPYCSEWFGIWGAAVDILRHKKICAMRCNSDIPLTSSSFGRALLMEVVQMITCFIRVKDSSGQPPSEMEEMTNLASRLTRSQITHCFRVLWMHPAFFVVYDSPAPYDWFCVRRAFLWGKGYILLGTDFENVSVQPNRSATVLEPKKRSSIEELSDVWTALNNGWKKDWKVHWRIFSRWSTRAGKKDSFTAII